MEDQRTRDDDAEEQRALDAELVYDSVVAEDEEAGAALVEGDHLSERTLDRRRQRQRAFLSVFAQLGIVRAACELVKIPRATIYTWIEKDPAFAAQFERAREVSTDSLEAECRRRATQGVPEPVFYQGKAVGVIQKYSDLCLLALLNAYRPEKFKNRHEHTGKDGGPVAVVHVSYDHNMKPDDMPG